jgi:trimeric autotransporter adhesin
MNHVVKAYCALICILAAAADPALAGTWDPVSSDGMNNTAIGSNALSNPNLDSDGGCHNTASGADALRVDTDGSFNTANGFSSLTSNLTGDNNAAFGTYTLFSNTSGGNNTASGYSALYYNTSGANNTAAGYQALYSNTNGSYNTAEGFETLSSNSTGSYSTAVGSYALKDNRTGDYDAAFGYEALFSNATGSNNIAMGYRAGYSLSSGSNTIEIGNQGSSADNDLIRIGTQGTQTQTYIAGIHGTAVTGSAVYVTSTGQLGVQVSSERYKTDIATMPEASAKLRQLRPVTFHYKTDPHGVLQYGLIAEEVDKVYPELVLHDESGKIQGVRYEELAPMLLGEAQRQQDKIAAQEERLAAQDAKIQAQAQQLAELKQMNQTMQAAIEKLLTKDERTAMR